MERDDWSPQQRYFVRMTIQDCVFRALKTLDSRLTMTKSTAVIKGHLNIAAEHFARDYEIWAQDQLLVELATEEQLREEMANKLLGKGATNGDGNYTDGTPITL